MSFPMIFLFENRLRSHTKDSSLGGVTFSPVFLCKKIGAFYIKISDFRLNALDREKVKQVCGLSPVALASDVMKTLFFMGKTAPLAPAAIADGLVKDKGACNDQFIVYSKYCQLLLIF